MLLLMSNCHTSLIGLRTDHLLVRFDVTIELLHCTLSQTQRLRQTFCNMVTSWETITTPPSKFCSACDSASIPSISRWLEGSSRIKM